MVKMQVNFEDTKGQFNTIIIKPRSFDTADIINALLPEIKKNGIKEVFELFDTED